MLRTTALSLALLSATALPALAAVPVSLRGSPASMVRQHEVAVNEDYSFLRTGAQVQKFATEGYLVKLPGNGDYGLADVSYPYARAEVRTFVERLAAQYRAGCGERLIVTSLTRPKSMQPRNAHDLSVHPAGMAVDLRVSQSAACRQWLEGTLLSLEAKGLLDVTREKRPPHYHVAIFTGEYSAYVARSQDRDEDSAAAALQDQLAAVMPDTGEAAPEATTPFAAEAVPAAASALAASTPAAPHNGARTAGPLAVLLLGLLGYMLRPDRRRSYAAVDAE